MDELLKIVQRFGDELIAGDDASFLKQRLPIRENREALAAK